MGRYDTPVRQSGATGGRYGGGGGRYGNWTPPDADESDGEDLSFADDGFQFDVKDLETNDADSGAAMPEWAGPAAMGAIALGGAALMRNPAGAAKAFNNLRMAAMLTGWAPAKSVLGNLGAGINMSVERGTLAPLMQLMRPKTGIDAVKNFITGGQGAYGTAGPQGIERYYNLPGRFMGAVDEAAGAAFSRAGLSADEVQRELLQAPMQPGLAQALEGNEVGRYLLPFARIPFNQFIEGLESFKSLGKVPGSALEARKLALLLSQMGVGYAEGANTEGAIPLALGAAAGGRYGAPVIAGQIMGRTANGGNIEEAARGWAPASDFSFEKSWTDPFSSFKTAGGRISKLLGY